LHLNIVLTKTRLNFPPFDKKARMIVHQLANKFKIKSQSAGKGNGRYPVLYRTKLTRPFDQGAFDRAIGRVKQTWFGRVDVDESEVNEARSRVKVLRRPDIRSGRGSGGHATTLREGEVIGKNAKELGIENKGRAMLEKMGWSKGMALGTDENKGIMMPIQQVVKKTKAGLGDL
jgi:hypothetical protein